VPYLVVALNKVDAVDDPNCWSWWSSKVRDLLKAYSFRVTMCRWCGSRLWRALNGEEKWEKQVDALMEAVDKYIPQPARELEQAVPDADRGYFLDSGARHGGDGQD